MTPEELRNRTKAFSLRVVKLAASLPRDRVGDVFARQVLRSGTAVAANYRTACRGRSYADFVSKIGVVEEEADETVFWIEMIADTGVISKARVTPLLQEAREILAIVTTARKTAKRRHREGRSRRTAATGPTPPTSI